MWLLGLAAVKWLGFCSVQAVRPATLISIVPTTQLRETWRCGYGTA